MYTPDQLANVLGVSEQYVRKKVLWYEGREVGAKPVDKLRCINIATLDDPPVWRVSEQELIRWMKKKGLRYYERSWAE